MGAGDEKRLLFVYIINTFAPLSYWPVGVESWGASPAITPSYSVVVGRNVMFTITLLPAVMPLGSLIQKTALLEDDVQPLSHQE